MRFARCLVSVTIALVVAGVVSAQSAQSAPKDSIATFGAPRRVEGRVVVVHDSTTDPVVGTWVTLHRVAQDGAGPLDSLRTDARGGFAFRYRPTGSDDALYFASTRYGGVAYFTSPLKGDLVRGEAAEITVFDTTSRAVPTTVRGRHLIVAAPAADGARSVIEVFELSNDSSVTRVERDERGAGTWSTAVPARARRFEVREGEVPADALVLAGGRAVLHMPLGPGLKQVAFSYQLPAEAFPLDLTTESRATVLEVLVEDPHGTVTGPRLVGTAPVTVEGRAFRRFLAQDVPASSRVTLDLPAPSPSWIRWVLPSILGLVGLAMVGALARPRRRTVGVAPVPVGRPPRVSAPEPERLARAIAALDDEFARDPHPSDAARASYQARRGALKNELATTLGRPDIER